MQWHSRETQSSAQILRSICQDVRIDDKTRLEDFLAEKYERAPTLAYDVRNALRFYVDAVKQGKPKIISMQFTNLEKRLLAAVGDGLKPEAVDDLAASIAAAVEAQVPQPTAETLTKVASR